MASKHDMRVMLQPLVEGLMSDEKGHEYVERLLGVANQTTIGLIANQLMDRLTAVTITESPPAKALVKLGPVVLPSIAFRLPRASENLQLRLVEILPSLQQRASGHEQTLISVSLGKMISGGASATVAAAALRAEVRIFAPDVEDPEELEAVARLLMMGRGANPKAETQSGRPSRQKRRRKSSHRLILEAVSEVE